MSFHEFCGVHFQASGTTTDNSCESVVMSGQQHQQQNPTKHTQKDANNPAG